jgi:putative two-component system response regulator
VEVNEAFIKDTGTAREALMTQQMNLLSHLGQEARWPEIQATLQKVGRWTDELYLKSEDRYFSMSISVVDDDAGKPFALVAVEKDVTMRRRLEQEARSAQYEVIFSLAKLAEYRDPETFAHIERIRHYCHILAYRLSLFSLYQGVIDEAFIEALFASSPLHDVGKVGIPDGILLKPGRLTGEEVRIMQLHTRIGEQILSTAGSRLSQKTWLSMAKQIALQHHEKFDGTGYPHGLAGPQIELSARIVALADAYDAITSKRVYKEAYSHEEAKRRILQDTGSHFDPDVVQAFLEAEQEFLAVRKRYEDSSSEDDLSSGNMGGVLARIERLLASSTNDYGLPPASQA